MCPCLGSFFLLEKVMMDLNSDQTPFLFICQLFEQLNQVTCSIKRTSTETEEGTAIYLSKNIKKQVYHIISQWFNQFSSGSLLAVFRLLVPEVP